MRTEADILKDLDLAKYRQNEFKMKVKSLKDDLVHAETDLIGASLHAEKLTNELLIHRRKHEPPEPSHRELDDVRFMKNFATLSEKIENGK